MALGVATTACQANQRRVCSFRTQLVQTGLAVRAEVSTDYQSVYFRSRSDFMSLRPARCGQDFVTRPQCLLQQSLCGFVAFNNKNGRTCGHQRFRELVENRACSSISTIGLPMGSLSFSRRWPCVLQ
jgi:hypothetical protein